MTFRLLILGGSAEAFALANALAHRPGLEMITSFAGRTKTRRPVPGKTRIGGFGGPAGLAAYLEREAIDAVVDATHPFASRIKANAETAAQQTGTALLHILRPPWQPGKGDDWLIAADMREAARMAPEAGQTFLTVGRTELAPFAARENGEFLARIIDPPEDGTKLGRIKLLQARGPFRLEDERKLFAEHAITCLVTKNSGGTAANDKLTVARERGIPVIMVARPAPPQGKTVAAVDEALAWLEERLHEHV